MFRFKLWIEFDQAPWGLIRGKVAYCKQLALAWGLNRGKVAKSRIYVIWPHRKILLFPITWTFKNDVCMWFVSYFCLYKVELSPWRHFGCFSLAIRQKKIRNQNWIVKYLYQSRRRNEFIFSQNAYLKCQTTHQM